MTVWRWMRADLTYAVHDRQLAEHGGLDGVRDKGAVESALARPQYLDVYADADAAALSATTSDARARPCSPDLAEEQSASVALVKSASLSLNLCRSSNANPK